MLREQIGRVEKADGWLLNCMMPGWRTKILKINSLVNFSYDVPSVRIPSSICYNSQIDTCGDTRQYPGIKCKGDMLFRTASKQKNKWELVLTLGIG